MRRLLTWLVKAVAIVIVCVIAGLTTVLLYMRWEHDRTVELPIPTGSFEVGRTSVAWIDDAHVDELSPSGEKRQVRVWIWYPAAAHAAARADYLPPAWRRPATPSPSDTFMGALMHGLFNHDDAAVRAHSFADPPVASAKPAYPVVLLRPGGGALTTGFTTLAEGLASHGYVVVGFDAPYRSLVTVLADGRVVRRLPAYNVENANGNLDDPLVSKLLTIWIADTTFVVDRLEALNRDPASRFRGRLDLQRLGMVGHSFGGATALQFCHEDGRCRAAIDMDGIPFGSVVHDGLGVPAMFVLSDHSREMVDPSSARVLAEIQSIYARLPPGRMYAVIRGANHFSFSDQILLNSQLAIRLLRLFGLPSLDTRRGLAISSDLVDAFFDVQLGRAPREMLTRVAEKYPEIQLQGK